MKIFTPEQIKNANVFFENYLAGNVDIENISASEMQKNIALPSLFKIAFTTLGQECKLKINRETKIGDFGIEVGIFCYPNNGELDAYPDPTELLKIFMPKWFHDRPEENQLIFNIADKKTSDLTLQQVISAFNDVGVEIDQRILYDMQDCFKSILDAEKKPKLRKK